jgi:hypothetical protein
MAQEMKLMIAYTQGHRSYARALNEMQNLASEERPGSVTVAKSERRQKMSSRQISPSRSGESNGGEGASGAIAAARQLLRSVALSLEPSANISTTEEALLSARRESKAQLHNLIQRLDATVESSMAVHIGQNNKTLELLLDQLYANSPGNRVHLMSPELEGGINGLGQRVSEVGAAMSSMDMNPPKEDDERRMNFEARWT